MTPNQIYAIATVLSQSPCFDGEGKDAIELAEKIAKAIDDA